MYKYFIKIQGLLVNQSYIYSHYFLAKFKPKTNLNILFSKKVWWDKLIKKGPFASQYNASFSIFELSNIESFDIVVPLTIPDMEFCMANESLLGNNPIPFPSIESFTICNNKSEFDIFMRKYGFSTYLPDPVLKDQFPFILKNSIDEGGENIHLINNVDDINKHKEIIHNAKYIKQGIISGEKEYAAHILIKNGKVVNALTIIYIFDKPVYIKGKDKYICRNVCKNKHIKLFEEVLVKMDFNGLCCFNYKEEGGTPKILEINPRFGGSLCEFFYPFLQKAI
jgi:hypothetical protein